MRDAPASIIFLQRKEESLSSGLIDHLPDISIVETSSEQEVEEQLGASLCPLLIVDIRLLVRTPHDFIRVTECTEAAPSVIFVITHFDPELVISLHNSGCHKILLKMGDWTEILAREVRAVLRLRRIASENELLVSQLHEANQLLREKNRRLDEFCAVLAHDIRGPLGNIFMKLDFMSERLEGKLDERSMKFLTTARESTGRLIDIVQVMYEFARLGGKAAKMGEVNLSQLIHEILSDLYPEEQGGLDIQIDTLPKVWGNAELLRTLFANLFANSVKYKISDTVKVTVRQGRLVERSVGVFTEIVVADDGPGLPEGSVDLFTLFKRGSKEKVEGLGVGLAVVQRIVDLHLGHITLIPQGDEGGATFVFTLPLKQPFML